MRLEELQKEAQRLQEEMEQEEALRKKGRERKAQVQEKLAQNRERYPYVQKCAKLAESLLVQYREKQEYTQRAANAKQEQLLKEQEMQAQEKAEQTALQRKNALAEEYGRLQSRLVPGLFFCGEVLDVTGLLGGYNLHWAFASAHLTAGALRAARGS